MSAPALLWIAAHFRALGPMSKRLLAAALAMTTLSLVSGVALELRIFIPAYVALIVAAVWGEARAAGAPGVR